MIETKQKTFFRNNIVTKKYLQEIMFWSFRNYGIAKAGFLADSLKTLGFTFATQAAISISIEDLKVPELKTEYIEQTTSKINKIETAFNAGEITQAERYQLLKDNWNLTSEKIKDNIINFFKNFDPLNPVYIMAFSGARGNLSQVLQLVGIRGLMVGPSGNVIDIPITKNFREGLSITDYMISAYGARKGIVDTALKTADSGYLTRRLTDAAQDILIREIDCETPHGIYLFKFTNNRKDISLKDRIVGRVLSKDVINPTNNEIIAKKNEQINVLIAKKIEQSVLQGVVVRSPLTCKSNRSTCKNCYGWNLGRGKLVDLGEAVGIIAGQSIGEPATQLTMRTFHTGGVFKSNSNSQFFSKTAGQVLFSTDLKTLSTRTVEGKNALITESSGNLQIVNFKNYVSNFFLKKNTILFVKNREFIKKDEILAYLPKIVQESENIKKGIIYSAYSGEIIANKNPNKINFLNKQPIRQKKNYLIWILSSNVFSIPFYTKLTKYKFSNLNDLNTIAYTKIISYNSGIIIQANSHNYDNYEIKLLIDKFNFENCKLYNSTFKNILSNKKYKYLSLLNFNDDKFYQLNYKLKFSAEKYLTIGKLINSNFRTNLSGIPYFIKIRKFSKCKLENYDYKKGGTIFYLPEEIFLINKDSSCLFIKDKTWIKSNTELTTNIYNKNPGFIKIIKRNDIVNKIIIRSGVLIPIKSSKNPSSKYYKKLFFKGEKIFDKYELNQLTYIEIVKQYNNLFLLLRPVFLYELPRTKYQSKISLTKFEKINFQKLNYIGFKNKERIIVNNNNSIDIIKTDLIFFNNKNTNSNSFAELWFTRKPKFNFSLACNIFENIFMKNNLPKHIEPLETKVSFFIKQNQYIEPYTLIGNIELFNNLVGKISTLKEKKQFSFRRILITLPSNSKTFYRENKTKIFKEKNSILNGDFLSNNLLTTQSCIIKYNAGNEINVHLAKPVRFSNVSQFLWSKNDLIKKNESLGILFYQQAQTGDIIKGLPKVEEILEARKSKISLKIPNNPALMLTTFSKELNFIFISRLGFNIYHLSYDEEDDFSFYGEINEEIFISQGQPINSLISNPHNKLRHLNYFYRKFLTPYKAAYRSIRKIQYYLLNAIQEVYYSQEISIGDKHIEIIIKKMTSKVKVIRKGDSAILRGEYIDLQQIHNMNSVLKKTKSKEIIYEPILLGITKASLVTDSFVSSASFQETIRILTNAAIQGKVDWLRGLKENVIVGRLIPSGTGFNAYQQISHLSVRLPKPSLLE